MEVWHLRYRQRCRKLRFNYHRGKIKRSKVPRLSGILRPEPKFSQHRATLLWFKRPEIFPKPLAKPGVINSSGCERLQLRFVPVDCLWFLSCTTAHLWFISGLISVCFCSLAWRLFIFLFLSLFDTACGRRALSAAARDSGSSSSSSTAPLPVPARMSAGRAARLSRCHSPSAHGFLQIYFVDSPNNQNMAAARLPGREALAGGPAPRWEGRDGQRGMCRIAVHSLAPPSAAPPSPANTVPEAAALTPEPHGQVSLRPGAADGPAFWLFGEECRRAYHWMATGFLFRLDLAPV